MIVSGGTREVFAFLKFVAFIEVGNVFLVFKRKGGAVDQVLGRLSPEPIEGVVNGVFISVWRSSPRLLIVLAKTPSFANSLMISSIFGPRPSERISLNRVANCSKVS